MFVYSLTCGIVWVHMRILILDIETTPHVIYSYDLWKKNFYTSPDKIIKESAMLSWAAKWTHEKRVHYMDTRMCSEDMMVMELVSMMEEADIVVAHNGKAFDIKIINDRAGLYKIPLPHKYRMVDTCKLSKKYCRTPYHNLKFLCERYNKKHFKLDHGEGMKLSIDCMAGKRKAWALMKRYNIADVLALEELYMGTLKAWDVATTNWIGVQMRKKKRA